MSRIWSLIAALAIAGIGPAWAQEQSANRTASGKPDTDIRVGVYISVRPEYIGSTSVDPADITT